MKNKKKFQRIVSFLFVFVFLFLAIPLTSSAAPSLSVGNIESSDVVNDLERMGIDITEYPKNVEDDTARMLTFLEYDFDYYSHTSTYGLYVYMYNPSGKTIQENGNNYIQLQCKKVDNTVNSGWKKYKLALCSASTLQGYENVFFKFKVADVSSFRKDLSVSMRHYDISGVELHYTGDTNATDFNVGGVYSFTGYMPYRDAGRTVNNSLQMYVRDRQTIELELHPVSWKTKTSDKGAGYQYEVFSVYFSVPNHIIRDYGDFDDETKGLVNVHGSFDEQKINGVVTNNQTLYDAVFSNLGKTASESDGFFLYGGGKNGDMGPGIYSQGKAYNIDVPLSESISKICTAFKVNPDTFMQSSSTDFEYELFSLMNSLPDGRLPVFKNVDSGHVRGFQYYDVTDKDDLSESIASYASQNSKFMAWMRGESNLYIEDEDYGSIKGIQAVNSLDVMKESVYLSDEAIAEKYFMQQEEAGDFKRYVVSSAVKGRTTYILRYAVRDYYAFEGVYYGNSDQIFTNEDSEGLYFEKTIFFDFDVLSLTWENKYQQRTIIPVVCSPVNNFGTVSPPRNPSILGSIVDGVGDVVNKGLSFLDFLKKIKPVLQIILVLIVLAVVFWFLSKFMDVFRFFGDRRDKRRERKREKQEQKDRKREKARAKGS